MPAELACSALAESPNVMPSGHDSQAGPPVCNLYSSKQETGRARFFCVSHNRTVAFEPLGGDLPWPRGTRGAPERRAHPVPP